MLMINRLRVEIHTTNGLYGIDEAFSNGLNFVSSNDNTCGKSSILAAIYYCLGFEQILGGVSGVGNKVLTSVFKTAIEDDGEKYCVTESGAYLEISNGNETVTVYRNIVNEFKDDRLITVYYCPLASIGMPNIECSDYYVNITYSATREKGFHTFLEKFLHLQLPFVRGSDGNDKKLYLQVLFSAMIIEQKHGWSGLLSGMPILGIRESRKRTVEYILGLDTFANEQLREALIDEKSFLEREWEETIDKFSQSVSKRSCILVNVPLHPRVLSEMDISRIGITTHTMNTIAAECEKLQKEYDELSKRKPRAIDNFELLNQELSATETDILEMESQITEAEHNLISVRQIMRRLKSDIKEIATDIRNNEDAARLQKFGSESAETTISANICPICKQPIQDNLLDTSSCTQFMNIEENLRHLKAQKNLLEFSLNSRRSLYDKLMEDQKERKKQILTLRRLAQALRTDLNISIDTDASEAIILKKLQLSKQIEDLKFLQVNFDNFLLELSDLSNKWNDYLDKKKKLPPKGLSEQDTAKIELLKTYFIANLKKYHYSSVTDLNDIDISGDTLMPTIDGFDMKFDSSASDGIRMIWAYTLSLLKVSMEQNGNHPGIVIFDEPAQQSIVPDDMKSFIQSVTYFNQNCQIIMGITLNSQELINIVNELDATQYHQIFISKKAFQKFSPDITDPL